MDQLVIKSPVFRVGDGIIDMSKLSYISDYFPPHDYNRYLEQGNQYVSDIGGCMLRFENGAGFMFPMTEDMVKSLQAHFTDYNNIMTGVAVAEDYIERHRPQHYDA